MGFDTLDENEYQIIQIHHLFSLDIVCGLSLYQAIAFKVRLVKVEKGI